MAGTQQGRSVLTALREAPSFPSPMPRWGSKGGRGLVDALGMEQREEQTIYTMGRAA